jgi:vitamin B12 transporter
VPAARIGARYRLVDELAIFINGGRYARVPTLGELYGVGAGALGNDLLEPELGWTVDLGVSSEVTTGVVAAYAQVVGFARVTDALIAYRQTSLGAIRPYNIASARVVGIESAAGVTLHKTVALSSAVTVLDPRDTSDERDVAADLIPLQARLVVSPRIELRAPSWPSISLDRATLGASLSYRSSRVADPAGLIVLDQQARMDLDVALAFAKRVALRTRMQNVLDTQVFDVVGYPLPGRALHAELEVEL